MEALGAVTTVYSLLQDVLQYISHLRNNPSHKLRLEARTQRLIDMLEHARDSLPSSSVSWFTVNEELQSVAQSVAARHGFVNWVSNIMRATNEHDELEAAERKLEALTTQVVSLSTVAEVVPTICNDRPALPSEGGLDRSGAIMKFLQRSKSQPFRVVCIHGMAGLGKTTLLNKVWDEASSTAPFTARAYVQIGHDASLGTICKAQSALIAQMCNINIREFPSCEIGRGQLKFYLQGLKDEGKPVLLAIDNVFEEADLSKLLPYGLELPTSSCVIMTCRDYRVVRSLLRMLTVLENDEEKVLIYEPPFLDMETSRRVFAGCAGFEACEIDECQELIEALVPMCGGLPLAVTVLGRIFLDKERRKREEWTAMKGYMERFDADNEDTCPISRALQLSYSRLAPSRQEAFLDIVSTFYGWRWETVEAVVGEEVMRSLKNSSLISQVDSILQCNQTALRPGYQDYGISMRVTMHDLTLRFGENILRAEQRIYATSDLAMLQRHTHLLGDDLNKVRQLHVSSSCIGKYEEVKTIIEEARFKRMLLVSPSSEYDFNVSATLRKLHPDPMEDHLRYVHVEMCDASNVVFETIKGEKQVLGISVDSCGDLVDLEAVSSLPLLKTLRITFCPQFRSLGSGAGWQSLQVLEIYFAQVWMEDLPDALGCLPKLRRVHVEISNLIRFPRMRNPNGLSSLTLRMCRRLQETLTIECDLEELRVVLCDQLREIHVAGGALRIMKVQWCELLTELRLLPPPRDIDSVDISVYGCPNLTSLPEGIIPKNKQLREIHVAGGTLRMVKLDEE